MKTAALVARYLLGLMFLIFGLNGFLHFIPQPPMAAGPAAQFMQVMGASHYMVPVFFLQIVGGVLLLANRFVPIALVILAPIIVNILIFHATMLPQGLPPGVIALVLWMLVFTSVRSAFAGVLAMKVGDVG